MIFSQKHRVATMESNLPIRIILEIKTGVKIVSKCYRSVPVVAGSERAEALLSCSIPNGQLDLLLVNLNELDLKILAMQISNVRIVRAHTRCCNEPTPIVVAWSAKKLSSAKRIKMELLPLHHVFPIDWVVPLRKRCAYLLQNHLRNGRVSSVRVVREIVQTN